MQVLELNNQVNKNMRILESLGNYTAGDFEVASSPVRYVDTDGVAHTDSNNKVLYRKDTGDVLNVVKNRYKMAQYRDSWRAAERILASSNLNLEGVTRRMEESHNGGRAFAVYTLPAHTVDLGKGDESALQISAYSSFDGSWCFTLEVGAVRMLCANSQVSINGFSLYKSKHTPSLNIGHGVGKISKALEVYEKEAERWKRWKDQVVTNRQAFDTFAVAANCKFPKSQPNMTVHSLLEEPEVYRNKALLYMWNQYTGTEQKHLGSNEWAVFNAMTHWATHAKAAKKTAQANIASIKVRRNEQVRTAARSRLAA
tara:strand:+ start:49 stop:987 length:939 start_codon:yes stop_codon:yes gene_type:complete